MDSPSRLRYYLPLGGPGFDLVEQVSRSIDRYSMLRGGEHVLVAVSGGADSQCLLDVLRRLGERYRLHLSVAHVDHGTSDASTSTGARVAKDAVDAGIEAHYVAASGLEGPNFHARARDVRYQFFGDVARAARADAIATGHTLDDRVETTLSRLVHGAGTQGLSGIPPVDAGRIRPLIDCRRTETRAYCESRRLWFVDDPANSDLRFERARVRATLIPAVEAGWGDGGVRAAAVSAERLREDALALGELAGRLYRELARDGEGKVSFGRGELSALPPALQRRLLETAVGPLRDRAGGIDAAVTALGSESTRPGSRFALPDGRAVVVERDEIVVTRGPGRPPSNIGS